MFDRITFDSQTMDGRACIRGMPVTVSRIVGLIADGKSAEQITREIPGLEPEDVRQALQYAAELTRQR